MKLRETLQKRFLAPVIGLLFAFFLCFVNSQPADAAPLKTTPVNTGTLTLLADLEDGLTEEENAPEPTAEEAEETTEAEAAEASEEETPETCYDQVKGIGWLVCPTSGVLAQAVDSIYNIIEKFLVVEPLSTNDESPIYIVWLYVRDLTNIVFVLLILVVVYSQLTGIGFDNYNIKKILPKIIVTAVLINLSYLICSALVDVSNIIGTSLRGFFSNIETNLTASGEALVSWGQLAGVLAGGGAIAGFTISATGGFGAFLWAFLPAVLSGVLAVIVGLITIAMRQAVVALLVMVAPLAIVCYMLPNTNKWFTKWKDILSSMLFFFPMFSALFGASHLAGWAFIVKAQQDGSYPTLILGMAIQVVPLFLCVPLMKMSGSVLGQVSSKLTGLTNGINAKAKAASDDRRELYRSRNLAKASTRNFNPASGASWAAFLKRQQAIRDASRAANENTASNATALHVNARQTGRRITGWRKDGSAIYASTIKKDEEGNTMYDEHGKAMTTDKVKVNKDMRDEYRSRELKLATEAEKLKTDNAMSDIKTYMRASQIKQDKALGSMASAQAQNYLNLRTQQSAKARNDRADQRFYFEQVQEASRLDKKTGETINTRLYHDLVTAGAGADAYDISEHKETIRQNALTTVTADAYEAYEKARKETTSKYATYFDKQITKNVLYGYNGALKNKNIDAVVAAQDTLAKRGDYDKIEEYLAHFMDHTANKDGSIDFTKQKDYVELGTDFANVLAGDLMGMKDAAPILGRLGKFINMETWRNSTTDGEGNPLRARSYITMEEYNTGGYNYIDPKSDDQTQTYNVKTSAATLQKGTSLANVDRTGFGAMQQHIERYHHGDEKYFTDFVGSFLPEIISNMPKFETDGEQIMNTLGFMTGMKWSEKSNMWERNSDTQIHMDIIKKYMDGLTDKDVNVLKTNAYQAICSAIAADMGQSAYITDEKGNTKFEPSSEVLAEFRGMVREDVRNTLQNNINQGTNVGMKESIRKALGLTIPKP